METQPYSAQPSEIFPEKPITQDDKTMAILAHILTLVCSFIAPLIIYLIKKDEGPSFALAHAKESLNFQLSLIIYFVLGFVLIILLVGIFILAFIGLFALIVTIIATVKAANGEMYRYPLCIRMIR
jgi:uncharacterized protein